MTADTVKHTRGPWQYRQRENDDWGFVRSADGWLVAVAKDSSVPFKAYGAYRERKEDPFEANARLIAAAPELLLALQELLDAYSKPDERLCCDGRDCGCMGSTVHQQAEHYARAAIAKATGGQ